MDVGGKRTGMAVSDDARIFAFPLETVSTSNVSKEIQRLMRERNITALVLGMPVNLRNEETDGTRIAVGMMEKLRKEFPKLEISAIDERFTSRIAQQALIAGGMKKSDRQRKENTDKVSAVLILQSFLEQQSKAAYRGIE
jgi:putative Holliday junction resolvase